MELFTCLVKKEGNQYASLCIELDIASCGDTKEEAVEGLKDAIDTYLDYMISEGRENEIHRPVPIKDIPALKKNQYFKFELLPLICTD